MNLLNPPSPGRRFTSVAACFWAYGMFLCLSLPFALAGPENPQVVNGDVSIQQSGYNTTITASDKAIINYSSFDIARPETVQFIQPDSSASVLNRILSATPTTIDGTLLANGCVFFVNPAGVYFGEGAQVNVNQLVASALNISDSDFMNGRYDFASGDGAVVNSGTISAERVALIGQEVTNSGSINCPGGYVVMAAGDRVFLAEPGSDVIVEVSEPDRSEPAGATDSTSAVLNKATDDAGGGIRALAGAGDLYSHAISNVGTLSVSVETGSAGRTVLAGGGEVTNTGTIEATGGAGGQVTMEGTRVGQFATIHADGIESDGGNVDLRASQVVALSSDSLTTANAGQDGNGGEVIVFSPDTALFWSGARIEARGGAMSGNGGFVEVSGKQHVEVYGLVDTTAPRGEVGTFLIDPFDIEIGDWTPDVTKEGSWSGSDPQVWTAGPASGSQLDVGDLLGYLGATDVVVEAGGSNADITVTTPIDYSDAMYNDLTLTATRDIIIGQPITTGTHDLTLTADSDTSAGGNVSVGAAINLAAGNFTSSGADFDNTGGPITTNGGSVDLSGHLGAVTVGSPVDATGGGGTGTVNIGGSSITAGADVMAGLGVTLGSAVTADGTGSRTFDAGSGILSAAGAVTKTTPGNLTLGGAAGIGLGGTVEVQDGALAIEDTLTGQGDITASGDVTLAAGATLDGTDQTIDAVGGTLSVVGPITKTTAGSLTLGGDTGIDLDGSVEVQNGALQIEDAFTGQGNVTASTDVTLGSVATLDGGDQRIDAVGGVLSAGDTITKTTAGSLTLGGAGINLGSTVEVQDGALAIEDAFTGQGDITASGNVALGGAATLDGGDQRVDAVDGVLSAADAITKSTAGSLVLGGAGGIDLGGAVEVQEGALAVEDVLIGQGDITASGDLTLDAGATLDGTDQRMDAVNGTLSVAGPITKTTAGSLVLGGANGIDLGGTVQVQSGVLQIEDAFTGQGDITASTDVTLDSTATLDGGNQRIDAVGGVLSAGAITKTTAGNLALGGAMGIKLGDTVEVQDGSLTLEDNTVVATDGSVKASQNVVLADGRTLTGTSSLLVEAAAGQIRAAGLGSVITASGGSLTLQQFLDLDLADFSFGNQANTDLVLQSSGGSITAVDAAHGGKTENAADRWKSITADAHGQIALQGSGSVVTGALESATGNIEVLSTGGDLIVNGPVNADKDLLDSTGGGVDLTADAGRIYTDDGSGTLNVPLTGYSDADAGVWGDLHFGSQFRAAIFISSKDGLVLGRDATLKAYGTYYADVDDRPGVGFRTSGDGAGDLIDVAIYLGSPSTSELFNVDVRSKVDVIADYGGMVIDGGDAVTFKGAGSVFLTSEAFDMTNRLEVVSRSSITKEELVLGRPADQPKLPYAQNPEDIRTDWPLFAGTYVLRGELGVVGNARQLDWTESVPLALPKPLELEESGDVEGPDVESLIELLSELGIGVQPYLADAYAGSLSTDLRLLKAAERLQGLIAMLEDVDGTRTAALRVVVGRSFPTLDSISEEQVDSFRRELTGHAGDGTDHDLAGQTFSALKTYVDILSTDVGWPMGRSVGFVMARYVPRLTEGDDIRTAVVQMQLEQASGT